MVNALGTTLFRDKQFEHGFEELSLFRSISSINSCFSGTTFNGTLVVPGNITENGGGYAAQNLVVTNMFWNEGTAITFAWSFFYFVTAQFMIFPSTFPIIPNVCHASFTGRMDIVINGDNVITTSQQRYYSSSFGIFFYVKDDLVESYRSEESWTQYFNVNKILPISDLSVENASLYEYYLSINNQ